MKAIAASFLVLTLTRAGCASSSPDAVRYMTPRELNTNAARFDGAEVLVRGYLVLGLQGRSLYQSKRRFSQFERALYANRPDFDPADYDPDCLTLLNADVLLDNREMFGGRTMTLRGVFEKTFYLDGTILDLQALTA